jgi:hypothetical protein
LLKKPGKSSGFLLSEPVGLSIQPIENPGMGTLAISCAKNKDLSVAIAARSSPQVFRSLYSCDRQCVSRNLPPLPPKLLAMWPEIPD